MRYYELVRDMSNKFNLRLEIVRFARDYGISEAAREFKTTRKTVRKWVKSVSLKPKTLCRFYLENHISLIFVNGNQLVYLVCK